MSTTFEALQNRLNKTVIERLSNVTATVNNISVQGIFDNAYQLATVGTYGMASTAPVLTIKTSDVPTNPVGTGVVVNGTNYQIAAHEPDGTGISRLILEKTT